MNRKKGSWITDSEYNYAINYAINFTCWVQEAGEGSVESNPDFHVVILTFRLDI